MSQLTLTWQALLWCLLPLLISGAIFWTWNRDKIHELSLASLRMLLQLVGVGYVLTWLFGSPSLWVSAGVVIFMISISSWIAIRPVEHCSMSKPQLLLYSSVALAISVVLHLSITLFFVLPVDPWYTPSIFIPLAGMYFSNTMNGISLSVERYYSELNQHTQPLTARQVAFNAAMIPQINGLLAVGLVSLPGMMTGQILAGIDPLVAVRYQIMIMIMILGTTCVGSFAVLSFLSIENKKASLGSS